jgi:hypothetical protein
MVVSQKAISGWLNMRLVMFQKMSADPAMQTQILHIVKTS